MYVVVNCDSNTQTKYQKITMQLPISNKKICSDSNTQTTGVCGLFPNFFLHSYDENAIYSLTPIDGEAEKQPWSSKKLKA
jgi:hypothetical protein